MDNLVCPFQGSLPKFVLAIKVLGKANGNLESKRDSKQCNEESLPATEGCVYNFKLYW